MGPYSWVLHRNNHCFTGFTTFRKLVKHVGNPLTISTEETVIRYVSYLSVKKLRKVRFLLIVKKGPVERQVP